MKFNYTLLILLLIISACITKNEIKSPIVTGRITNPVSGSIYIIQPEIQYKKEIILDDKGRFIDTLAVENGFYTLFDGKEYANIYLKKGDKIQINLDSEKFDESISFKGEGSEENNFLAKQLLKREKHLDDEILLELSEKEFYTKLDHFVKEFESTLKKNNFSNDFVVNQKNEIESIRKYLIKSYSNKNYVKNKLSNGKKAPSFENYKSNQGKNVSLIDLKGQYVYIDIWATWCQPCKYEIPFLKELEKKYHKKNITFVSISVDEISDMDKWKNMVTEKKMGGLQLFSNKDMNLLNDYKVTSIPRFILIDPDGKIVNANAPRPSQKKIITELFNSLN